MPKARTAATTSASIVFATCLPSISCAAMGADVTTPATMPAMSKEDDRARDEFTGEAEELLDTLSRDLVEFESQGRDVRPEVINKIFREVHSLKGLAGMLGFVEISELSHNLEDMLDRLRMGKVEINKTLLDVLYDSVDSLNRLILAINDPTLNGLVDLTGLTSRIHQL